MNAVGDSRHPWSDAGRADSCGARSGPARVPDRVYVRLETGGRLNLRVWGMEHAGLRSEVVEPVVSARVPVGGLAVAAVGIERDLRCGVGLLPPL